jgi:hypothetical protein
MGSRSLRFEFVWFFCFVSVRVTGCAWEYGIVLGRVLELEDSSIKKKKILDLYSMEDSFLFGKIEKDSSPKKRLIPTTTRNSASFFLSFFLSGLSVIRTS